MPPLFHFWLSSSMTRSALRSILASDERESLPRLTICVARASALIACDLSSSGYLRWPGRPKSLAGRCLRAVKSRLPMLPQKGLLLGFSLALRGLVNDAAAAWPREGAAGEPMGAPPQDRKST